MSSSEEKRGAGGDWLHFVGVGGSGMSALAQFHALGGGRTTGSDRAFDVGERAELRERLEALGVTITRQDGAFLSPEFLAKAAGSCAGVVVSTAIEDKVPDIRAAREADLPFLHRSELLARHVAAHRSIAVTGTSGKSTVTAMIFSILRACGRGPGLLTGGAVAELQAEGHIGNAWAPQPAPGEEPLLVVEADESDGSVIRYHAWLGLVLNLGLDHKEPAEILEMFHTFRANTRGPFLAGDQDALAPLRDGVGAFGIREQPGDEGGAFARDLHLGPNGSRFLIDDVEFQLPLPGRYNVANAAAAVAACRLAGVSAAESARALADFQGVARRFRSVGTGGGVEVIDDFAHNPDKILAAMAAAHTRLDAAGAGRLLAVFQPHGFGPTRFLKDALVTTFVQALRGKDRLWMPEIFFAGGTVVRDISAGDLIREIAVAGRQARFLSNRRDIADEVARTARPGDLVLVMGARDPSLTQFCREILEKLAAKGR